jgi:putative FmdB family regulatory protein
LRPIAEVGVTAILEYGVFLFSPNMIEQSHMPTYDYLCDACGHTFEEFQYIKEAPLRKCPECKKMKLRRLIGAGAAIVFKGSGFYQTDYRSESYKKGESAAKPASSESSSSTSSSDTKSDAKASASDKASTDTKS